MGVSRAQKLKMKHQKISYFRHYVHVRKSSEDMNKSHVAYFFLLKMKINALDISNAFTKMKKEMLFVSALMWKNLGSTIDGISKFGPKFLSFIIGVFDSICSYTVFVPL